jgi:hypothetical protein
MRSEFFQVPRESAPRDAAPIAQGH